MELCDLSCEQVAQFIRASGLDEQYALSAVENEVDGESIVTSTKEKQLRKLLEMNKDPVAFLYFKVKIKRCYGPQKPVSQLGRDYPPQRIVELCNEHECLRSAVPFVKKHGIDGEMMLEADVDVFKQISTDFKTAETIIKKLLSK